MYNHQLDTFIKTADLGSFGKAGEALYISSTAVIQQINLLENLCGFKLFVRSNHGVKLTPAGRSSEVIAVSLNAQSPIVFNVLGKVKDVMFVHSRKAPDPIVSSLLPRKRGTHARYWSSL